MNSFFKEIASLFAWPHEASLRLLWLLILISGVAAIGFYVWDYIRLRKGFRAQIDALKDIDKENIHRDFAKVRASFEASPALKHLWQEFYGTLVIKSDSVLTTLDASHFFNEYALVDEPMKMEFRRHIPGMITSAGIIGTFAGLIIGLQDFSDVNLQESISQLLSGVNNAFACSFIAIFLAVLVTFTERQLITHLYAKVHDIQEHLNRLFNRSLTESYLHDMVGHMDQQTQSLKSFSQDLSESIRQAMQELVHQQTDSMSRANHLVAEQIARSMSDVLEPAVGRLADSVEHMQRQQAESNQQGLTDLVSRFGDTLERTTGRQMDGLMAAIAGSTETMATLKTEMSAFIHSVQAQSQAQHEQLQAQMTALTAFSGDQQKALQDELRTFIGQISGTMAELQQAMLQQSGESVSRLAQDLTRLVEGFQARQEEALDRLSTRMTHMHSELDSKLDQALRKLEEAGQEQTQRLASTVVASVTNMRQTTTAMIEETQAGLAEALAQVSTQTARMADGTDRLHAQLSQQVETMNLAAERIITQANTGAGEMAQAQERVAARLSELLKGLDQGLAGFERSLQGQQALMDGLASSLGRFQQASDAVAMASRDYASVHEKNQLLFAGIGRQVEAMGATATQLRQFQEDLKQTLGHHGQVLANTRQDTEVFFGAVREQVIAYRESVHASMSQYNEVAAESLGKFLGSVDTSLAKAVEMLGSSVGELEGHLDALADTLGKAGR